MQISYPLVSCTPYILILSLYLFSIQMSLYNDSNGANSFTALDYVSITPSWSLIGSSERGFDPGETRWTRKSRSKAESGC